jgi:transcriptional regulator with XRE-family HTH domain
MARVPPWKRPPVPPHPDQGRIIREARTSEGWGQRQLAEAVGVSQPYLCRLETGTRALSPRTAHKLGDVLGVTVPLPLIDFSQTAAGRDQARERERERLQAQEAARVQREAELSVYRLRQAVAMPSLRFGAFRAGRR